MRKYTMNVTNRDFSKFCWAIQVLISLILVQSLPALAVDPEVLAKKALCHSCLAKIYVAQKDYAAAMTEYQALIAIQPDDATTRFAYGALLAKSEKFGPAIAQYKVAAKLAPGVPEYQCALGNCYMYSKNYDAAVTTYTKACNLGGKYQRQLTQALQYQAQEKSLKQYQQKKVEETKAVQDDD